MNRPAQIAHARTAVLSEQASCPSAGNKYIGFIKLTYYTYRYSKHYLIEKIPFAKQEDSMNTSLTKVYSLGLV